MEEIQTGDALLLLLDMQEFLSTKTIFVLCWEIFCWWIMGNHSHLTGENWACFCKWKHLFYLQGDDFLFSILFEHIIAIIFHFIPIIDDWRFSGLRPVTILGRLVRSMARLESTYPWVSFWNICGSFTYHAGIFLLLLIPLHVQRQTLLIQQEI